MLAEIHKHINDSRISFDEAEHNYFIDGQKAKFSVTEIIDKFFPEFDSAFWAERKAIEKLNQDHVEYDLEVLQATIKQILEAWERKRIDAASKGTILHEKIEDFYNEIFFPTCEKNNINHLNVLFVLYYSFHTLERILHYKNLQNFLKIFLMNYEYRNVYRSVLLSSLHKLA